MTTHTLTRKGHEWLDLLRSGTVRKSDSRLYEALVDDHMAYCALGALVKDQFPRPRDSDIAGAVDSRLKECFSPQLTEDEVLAIWTTVPIINDVPGRPFTEVADRIEDAVEDGTLFEEPEVDPDLKEEVDPWDQ